MEFLGNHCCGGTVHDSHLIGATLKNSCEMGAWFLGERESNLCLDKTYDYERVYIEVYVKLFSEHIRSRGEKNLSRWSKYTPRHWVVERIFAWF